MQSECCNEAAVLDDDPLRMLERMDSQRPFRTPVEIQLEFPPNTYSFLVRVAELLRRPLEEMLGDFLVDSADTIAFEMSRSPQISEGTPDSDLAGWADMARAYHTRARQNLTPFAEGKKDAWGWNGITPPAAPMDAKPVLTGKETANV